MKVHAMRRLVLGATTSCLVLTSISAPVSDVSAQPPTEVMSNRRDIRFRESLGLRADDAHVDSLQRAWDAGRREGLTGGLGIPMTQQEYAEVSLRQDVAAKDAPVIRRYVAGLGAGVYGGLYLDNRGSGTLTLLVTRDAGSVQEALRARVTYPDRLRVVTAGSPLSDLVRMKDAIFDRRTVLEADGIVVTTTAVDEARNRVRVGVATDVQPAQARFDREHGPGAVVVVQEMVAPVGTTYPHSPPFKGGLQIETPGAPGMLQLCTSAFVGYRNTTPRTFYLLSAGHCGPNGSAWTQGFGPTVGVADRVDFSATSRADTLRIPIPAGTESNRTTVYYSPTLAQGEYRSMTSFQAQGSDVVGSVSCHSGINWTSIKCGTLIATSYDYTLTSWYGAKGTFRFGREVDFDCNSGDSGGSVWYSSEARGILSAKIVRDVARDTCIYGHIYDNVVGMGLTGIVTNLTIGTS